MQDFGGGGCFHFYLQCTWFIVNLGSLGSTQNVCTWPPSVFGKEKSNRLLAISKKDCSQTLGK